MEKELPLSQDSEWKSHSKAAQSIANLTKFTIKTHVLNCSNREIEAEFIVEEEVVVVESGF